MKSVVTMSYKCQQIITELSQLIEFLEPVRTLANSHLGSFFTENLWEVKVPKEIQAELNNSESLNHFKSFYSEIIQGNGPDEFLKNHPNLLSFINTVRNISIKNDLKYSKPLTELTNFFIKKGCWLNEDIKQEKFMSKKKLHEVKVLSKVTVALSNLSKSSHIIDVGGGKGYLSSVLALCYSCKVLGLDSCKLTTCGALKRSETLAKIWNEGSIKKESDNSKNKEKVSMTKKERKEFIKEHYKQVTSFVTSNTDVVRLLDENFNEEASRITMTGLHTCGDLAPTSFRICVNNNNINSIVNVGCCYHLITEEFTTNDFGEGVGCIKEMGDDYGFPMSNFLKRKQYKLGRNARMLASHSLNRIEAELEFPQTALLYKAILENTVKGMRRNNSRDLYVGRLASKCKNFHEYFNKALQKMEIDMQLTEKESNELLESYVDEKPKLTAFFLLRVTLAPIVESIILLDRLLYLVENGVENAHLVRLFDLEVSPRGFGIVAWKDFDENQR